MDFEHTKCIADMLNILKHHTVDGEDVTDEWFGHLFRYNAIPQEKMIGAIVKDNVSKARNDGKIRRFPWNARNWHLDMAIGICNAHDIPYYGEHESQIYARKSRNSAEKARDYHINSPRFRRGDILEEMRSELNIKPVDYFNFTGYPATVVR